MEGDPVTGGAIESATGAVRIAAVDVFDIELPVREERRRLRGYSGLSGTYTVSRISTDAGVTGYSFGGGTHENFGQPSLSSQLESEIRPALVGRDIFAIEEHLRHGLVRWGALEHALWDAIGKLLETPVYRLLGGGKESVKVYLTCVWPSAPDGSHVSIEEQAAFAVRLKEAGFKGMKIQARRPEPLDDAIACAEILAAVGDDFALMFDRTAHKLGPVWPYETALQVARGLQEAGATWLEEPLAQDDFAGSARLAREVEIPITGGEGYLGLAPYRESLIHGSYDILQPDAVAAGGIRTVQKIAALAEAWERPCILHGTGGLALSGCLHVSAAIGAEWLELAIILPPELPEEMWSPALAVLQSDRLYEFRDGEIVLPQSPGLGLDIDEDALAVHRVT